MIKKYLALSTTEDIELTCYIPNQGHLRDSALGQSNRDFRLICHFINVPASSGILIVYACIWY